MECYALVHYTALHTLYNCMQCQRNYNYTKGPHFSEQLWSNDYIMGLSRGIRFSSSPRAFSRVSQNKGGESVEGNSLHQSTQSLFDPDLLNAHPLTRSIACTRVLYHIRACTCRLQLKALSRPTCTSQVLRHS